MTLAAVKVSDLSYQYPKAQKYSLQNFTFEVPLSSCTVLLGLNGAGKSTFMSLLCGLLEAPPGSILFPAFSKEKVFLSYGTQSCALYHELSIFENMLFFARVLNPKHDSTEQIKKL